MERKGQKRKHSAPFKSPFQGAPGSGAQRRPVQTAGELRQKLVDVNKQINDLQAKGYGVDELQTHIDKLHEYNEVKDVGQMVLGRLATVQGLRTRDLYEKYGLDLED